MASLIKWKLDLVMNDRLSMSIVDEAIVEAYDKISVTVPKRTYDKDGKNPKPTLKQVSVQPVAKSEVQLLIIKSKPYKILSYVIADAPATASELTKICCD